MAGADFCHQLKSVICRGAGIRETASGAESAREDHQHRVDYILYREHQHLGVCGYERGGFADDQGVQQ